MGNAGGRLVGTLASGFLYEATFARFGLSACLWASAAFLVCSALAAARLTPKEDGAAAPAKKASSKKAGAAAGGKDASGGKKPAAAAAAAAADEVELADVRVTLSY